MIGWLLDTNVLSELRKPKPDRRVVSFVKRLPLETIYISSMTVAEIRFGIEQHSDPDRRIALADWLDQEIRPMFAHRVLAFTEDVMLRWRLLVEQGRKKGHTFSQPDLIIAATALHHGLTAVTRDTSEFLMAGASVLNPWVSQAAKS